MKKFASVLALVFTLFATASFAGDMMKRNVGCGMGSIWFADKEGLLFHLLATTSNGYSQTFGISSGTSGCTQFNGIVFNSRMESYVAQNLDNLATDMARGDGEYVQTLAVLMEVPVEQRTSFYSVLQQNFSRIYTSPEIQAPEVVRNISSVVQ
ncbi:MAG: DUF3015 family protein [Spirochaetes bacterium]|nr:DUF3015 family protein [Spirochaetota bacterium]